MSHRLSEKGHKEMLKLIEEQKRKMRELSSHNSVGAVRSRTVKSKAHPELVDLVESQKDELFRQKLRHNFLKGQKGGRRKKTAKRKRRRASSRSYMGCY